MSTYAYFLVAAAVVVMLAGRTACRPQTPEASQVEAVGGGGEQEETFFPLGQFGSVVGEVLAHTDSLTVSKLNKRKKQQQQNGPSASALVSEPQGATVNLSAGVNLVAPQATVELASAR